MLKHTAKIFFESKEDKKTAVLIAQFMGLSLNDFIQKATNDYLLKAANLIAQKAQEETVHKEELKKDLTDELLSQHQPKSSNVDGTVSDVSGRKDADSSVLAETPTDAN